METLEDITTNRSNEIALVVGNGINRFKSSDESNSWEHLLCQICGDVKFLDGKEYIGKIPLTEFSDLLQFHISRTRLKTSVQKEFRDKLGTFKYSNHHMNISKWAIKNNAPVLTTNFDTTLSDSCNAKLMKYKTTDMPGPTDYYPWSKYYSMQPIDEPHNSFGIWHAHGMRQHTRSIRLRLSDYMGAVQRVRSWMHLGGSKGLFHSKESLDLWKGKGTWLNAFFRNDLLIIGLGLNTEEVFLRWLLIERKRYFQKFKDLKRKAWYVREKSNEDPGRDFLLDMVDVNTVVVDNYSDIYESPVWQAHTDVL